MMKKWFGASLLIFVLALAGCSEEKAKNEEKPKTEEKENEKTSASEDMAKEQAEIINNMQKNAVALDPKALEADNKAYENKIIKATGTVSSEVKNGMGGSFELKVGDSTFKVLNFTMGSAVAKDSDIIVYGNVKTGKDAESGLPLINATYIE